MRIRSIKPEFWRSDDITGLPIATRLTFIGLWSYVDDNGVGADKLVSVVADLYADDFSRDPQETVQRVSEDLERLTSGGQVVRYRAVHRDKPKDLLYITKWKQHQVVNHPSKGAQYPLPPAHLIDDAMTLGSVSGESLETLTHEQGNRGTGERGNGAGEQGTRTPESDYPLPPEPPVDDWVAGEVVDKPPTAIDNPSKPAKRYASAAAKAVVRQELGTDYSDAAVNRIGVQVENLTRQGKPDDRIRETLREWQRRPNCERPEYIPTVYDDLIKKSHATTNGHDDKVNSYLAFATPTQNQLEIEP